MSMTARANRLVYVRFVRQPTAVRRFFLCYAKDDPAKSFSPSNSCDTSAVTAASCALKTTLRTKSIDHTASAEPIAHDLLG
eukprot:6207744-Pleurochrysis_carterae.AAC.2